MRRDFEMMLRVVLWLVFLLGMTPIVALVLRTMSRVVYQVDLD